MKIQERLYLPLTLLNARIISSYTEEKKKIKRKHTIKIQSEYSFVMFSLIKMIREIFTSLGKENH